MSNPNTNSEQPGSGEKHKATEPPSGEGTGTAFAAKKPKLESPKSLEKDHKTEDHKAVPPILVIIGIEEGGCEAYVVPRDTVPMQLRDATFLAKVVNQTASEEDTDVMWNFINQLPPSAKLYTPYRMYGITEVICLPGWQ